MIKKMETESKTNDSVIVPVVNNSTEVSNSSKDLKRECFNVEVNLIPPGRKVEIAKIRRLKLILRIELMVFIILSVFFLVLLSFNYVLKLDLGVVFADPNLAQNRQRYDRIVKYNEDFSRLNLQTGETLNMENDQLYWSKLLSLLSEKEISGIEITSLSTKDYNILIGGKADARDDLIAYKEKLDQEECFSGVDLPLSNLVLPKDIDFQISFKIKEDCLKKK